MDHIVYEFHDNLYVNLTNRCPCASEMKGLIDQVSISLNTPDPDRYLELTRSKFGAEYLIRPFEEPGQRPE